jgi:uncharacterized protein (DUF983 family)
MDHDGQVDEPIIVAPSGRPARALVSRDCPRCGAGPDRRLASGGYGARVHDVCGRCGCEDLPR